MKFMKTIIQQNRVKLKMNRLVTLFITTLLLFWIPLAYTAEVSDDNFLIAAITDSNLGNEMLNKGNIAEAEYYFRKALDSYNKVSVPQKPEMGAILNQNLGYVLRKMNLYREAITYYRNAFNFGMKADKKDWGLLRDVAYDIAEINLETEHANDAETIEKAEFALKVDNASGDQVNMNILHDIKLISIIYIARGDINNAVNYKRQFVTGVALMFGEDSLELAQQRAELGQFLLANKKNKEAKQNLDRAHQIVKANPKAPFKLRALILTSVGMSLFMNQKYDQCLPIFKEIDSLYQDNIMSLELKQRDKLASLYLSMGDVYIEKFQLDLADEYFQHSLRERIVSGYMDDIDIPILLFKIGQIAQRQEDYEKQLRLYYRFTELLLMHKPDTLKLKKNILILEVMLESAYKLFKEKGMSEMTQKTGQYMQSIGMSVQ